MCAVASKQEMFIALGANLPHGGMSLSNTLLRAMSVLEENEFSVLAKSRLFATPCFPAGSGPDFLNAICRVEAPFDCNIALDTLHKIEAEFGRVRQKRWGQRTLDLDLLAVGNQVLPDRATFERWHDLPLDQQMQQAPDQLILPHPRLQDRAFVLVPLMDVAPNWVHPVLGKTVQQMCAALPSDEREQVKPL